MKQKIKNALISVSDKTELIPILKILKKFKVKIIIASNTVVFFISKDFKILHLLPSIVEIEKSHLE